MPWKVQIAENNYPVNNWVHLIASYIFNDRVDEVVVDE